MIDAACDLLNVFVLDWGTFGMGIASAVSYTVQFLIIVIHFTVRKHYFRLSPRYLTLRYLGYVMKNGTPAFVKKLSKTLRDVLINYINMQRSGQWRMLSERANAHRIFV